ncbi:usg protein [Inquilinus limosus]|uniref:usg protein n=1 Tax=Inquilinus limosus TaxID=171674 RepID=UPI003F18680B
MTDLERQLQGYRLTTAEILYHMPDHPGLLQSFVWQKLDLAPRFPELHRFLDFWIHNIDGKLHSVRVASTAVVKSGELRLCAAEFRLH